MIYLERDVAFLKNYIYLFHGQFYISEVLDYALTGSRLQS